MRKKSYLSFKELRVFYDRKHNQIRLTTGDPELAAQGWSLTLNRETPAEQILRDMLIEAGIIEDPSEHEEITRAAQLEAIDTIAGMTFLPPEVKLNESDLQLGAAIRKRAKKIEVGEIRHTSAQQSLESQYGPYIGSTTGRVREPVFFSPHTAIARNQAPGTAIIGSPGSGKSFAVFTLAYQSVLRGDSLFCIDTRGEFAQMPSLTGAKDMRVLDLRDLPDGALNPAAIVNDIKELQVAYIELIDYLLKGAMGGLSASQRTGTATATKKICSLSNPSLLAIAKELAASKDEDLRIAGSMLLLFADLPLARLIFEPAPAAGLKLGTSVIITAIGLQLPLAEMPVEHYANANFFSLAIMHRLVAIGRQHLLSQDKAAPKTLALTEAWTLTGNRWGRTILGDLGRMGRALNIALLLVDPQFEDNMGWDISNWLVFRTRTMREIEDNLALISLINEQKNRDLLRNLATGEFLFREGTDSPKTVQFSAKDKDLIQAFEAQPVRAQQTPAAKATVKVRYGDGSQVVYDEPRVQWTVLREIESTMKARLNLAGQQGFDSYDRSLPEEARQRAKITVTIEDLAGLLLTFPEDSANPSRGTRVQLLRLLSNLGKHGARANMVLTVDKGFHWMQ